MDAVLTPRALCALRRDSFYFLGCFFQTCIYLTVLFYMYRQQRIHLTLLSTQQYAMGTGTSSTHRPHSGAAARSASPLLPSGSPLPELSPLALLSSSSDSVPYEVVRCQGSPSWPSVPHSAGRRGSPLPRPQRSVGRQAPRRPQPAIPGPAALCRQNGESVPSPERRSRDLADGRRPGAAVSVSTPPARRRGGPAPLGATLAAPDGVCARHSESPVR